jgi:hypothetical protein
MHCPLGDYTHTRVRERGLRLVLAHLRHSEDPPARLLTGANPTLGAEAATAALDPSAT